MSVFRRVKRVRLKLVEGSSCKSLVLIGFFSASPPPNKMWICDGDRVSGIFLSFGEEITASVLIGFLSASPSPSNMWIWDGDRESGIFLSFGEEITARK